MTRAETEIRAKGIPNPLVGEIPETAASSSPTATTPPALALPPDTDTDAVSDTEIATVAFSLFEARGREDGHDVEDWLAAEALIRERRHNRRE
jgi:hypothetical protein